MSEVKDPKIKLFGKTIELPDASVPAAAVAVAVASEASGEVSAQPCDVGGEDSSNQDPPCSSDSIIEDSNLNRGAEEQESSKMNSDHIDVDSEENEDLAVDSDTGFLGDLPRSNQLKRKREKPNNKKSIWWKYFDILPEVSGEPSRCACKGCGAKYLADSCNGTSNLKRHILKQCPRQTSRDIGQVMIEQTEKGLGVRSRKFIQEKFRELLISAIIRHELPFQFVEYEGIRAVFTYLEPQVCHFTRNTARADVIKMYKFEKNKLMEELRACPGKISFTSDLWTSIATDGYICLTAHYVDRDWALQKRIISFSYMPPPHSGIALCDKISHLLKEWGIEKKVLTITLDNASANDTFVEYFKEQLLMHCQLLCGGDYLHIRCCCHILNLIVQDGLKEIDKSVSKIRECVKYVKGSQVRKDRFHASVTHCGIDSRAGLRQDVPTRWNSTYLMLKGALVFRRAFNHLKLVDSNFTHCPSNVEWERVQKIYEFLEVFYKVTNLFSGTKYPTSNLYFPNVFEVEMKLNKLLASEDIFMRGMAITMFEKFDKYWNDYNTLFAIAVVFDPRYKWQFVDFCYKKLYGPDSDEVKKVKEKLFNLFDEYMRKTTKPSGSVCASSSSRGTPATPDDFPSPALYSGTFDVLMEFNTISSNEPLSEKSQLELYLDEPISSTSLNSSNVDVLAFWKAYQYRYPELAQMARDILTVPISTVASESAFSTGGRILDQYRSAMKPEAVEALVCCKDWLFGQKESNNVLLDDLTENIMSMFVNASDDQSTTTSITVDS